MTMQSVSEDLKDILLSESSLALTFGVDLFIGQTPAKPNNCVTIFDNPGVGPVATLLNDTALYFPSFQISVRNDSYLVGYNLIFAIMVLLHGRQNEVWNGTKYCSIVSVTDPFSLGYDVNGRVSFVCNFNVIRR
jgi:hypothetical protein